MKRHRRMATGLVASLGLNLILAGYLYLFVPNSPLRPVCYLPGLDTAELRGPLTYAFESRVGPTLGHYGLRVGPDGGRLYVTRWERWFNNEMLLNATNHAVRAIYRERGITVESPKCDDVRAVAIQGAE